MRRALLRPLLFLLWVFSLIPEVLRLVGAALRQFLVEVLGLFGLISRVRRHRRRRWALFVKKPKQDVTIPLRREDVERLLRRCRDLKDLDDLSQFGFSFRMPEEDFVVSREQVEEVLRRILETKPPFLFLGRTQPFPESPPDAPPRKETIHKRERVHIHETMELLIPEDHPIIRHSDQPPGSQALRPMHSLGELFHGSMLDRVLPPKLQMERLSHGDMMITEYVQTEPHLEFVPRERLVDYDDERETDIEVELEAIDPDTQAQLVYFLIDTSASMKGMSAILAASAFCAIHRANMAFPALYYMRSFADHLEPGWDQPPWQAETLSERESLYEKIFSMNFNGTATQIGWALEMACKDIEEARHGGDRLSQASIILITDGRSDLMPDQIALVAKTGAPVHTIMVSRDRNHDLERISESFTTLAGIPDAGASAEQ